MFQLTVIIRLTGLLALVPNAHTQGTDGGPMPMHALIPVEGDMVQPHVAQIGWRSNTAGECKYRYDAPDKICWASLDGWSVDIGQGGPPSNAIVPPDGAVALSNAAHRVDRDLFSDRPRRRLRSRVTLYSGDRQSECAYAAWHFRGKDEVLLSNVVTWRMQLAAMPTLVRRELDAAGNPDERPLDITPPATGQPLELFIRNIPAAELTGDPEEAEIGQKATDLQAIYDLLKIPEGERDYPEFQHETDHICKFTQKSPGAPTCLVGSGLP